MPSFYNRHGHHFAHLVPMLPVFAALLIFLLTSCGAKPNIQVQDYVIGAYEGAAGGAKACTEVHTLFTNISPAHFGLADCLQRLIGKTYMDGAALSQIQENIDLMCTSLGSCTYEQSQALSYVKQALSQAAFISRKK